MTGLDASSSLFKFFSENDYFDMDEHFKSVVLISENEKIEKACVEIGLEDLCEMGVIIIREEGGKNFWILRKPLSHYEQKVELSASTAMTLSHVLNEICVALGNKEDKCDPLRITENDVNNLITVASKFLENTD